MLQSFKYNEKENLMNRKSIQTIAFASFGLGALVLNTPTQAGKTTLQKGLSQESSTVTLINNAPNAITHVMLLTSGGTIQYNQDVNCSANGGKCSLSIGSNYLPLSQAELSTSYNTIFCTGLTIKQSITVHYTGGPSSNITCSAK